MALPSESTEDPYRAVCVLRTCCVCMRICRVCAVYVLRMCCVCAACVLRVCWVCAVYVLRMCHVIYPLFLDITKVEYTVT